MSKFYTGVSLPLEIKATNTVTSNKDQAIVTGLLNGDDKGFKEFYLGERQQFYDWCKSNSSITQEEINDLYQSSQMYLYENILQRRVNLSSSLRTYLYGIAKNQLSTRYRKNVTQSNNEAAVMEHLRFLAETESFESQEQQLIQKIRHALQDLKEPCKSILKLFYYELLSMKEIAEKLGYKNDSVVKSQKNRCIEQLRNSYKKGGNDE